MVWRLRRRGRREFAGAEAVAHHRIHPATREQSGDEQPDERMSLEQLSPSQPSARTGARSSSMVKRFIDGWADFLPSEAVTTTRLST